MPTHQCEAAAMTKNAVCGKRWKPIARGQGLLEHEQLQTSKGGQG